MSARTPSNHAFRALSNQSEWLKLNDDARLGFQEVWYLKANDPSSGNAFWLRWTILSSQNGFKNIAECWGIVFERAPSGEITKTALKQTFDLGAFRNSGSNGITIDQNTLQFDHQGLAPPQGSTSGKISSKGRSLAWDFRIKGQPLSVDLVPEWLAKLGVIKNHVHSLHEQLLFTGTIQVGDRDLVFHEAPGMQAHLSGPKNGHSWAWAQCNVFENSATGERAPIVIEALSARARLPAGLATPAITSVFLNFEGQSMLIHSASNPFSVTSLVKDLTWNFSAESRGFRIQVELNGEHRDFAGVTYEDTDGSYLYCSNSKISSMKLTIMRDDHLIGNFFSKHAAFEVVSRDKNPYVPILIEA